MLRTLLKREESYGVHALLSVARTPGITTHEMAEQLNIPPAFLAKVVAKLAKAGLLASQTGRRGGLQLRADLGMVSLLTVIEALSGPVVMDTCQLKPRCATEERSGRCGLKPVWLETTLAVRGILEGVKLAALDGGIDPQGADPRPARRSS